MANPVIGSGQDPSGPSSHPKPDRQDALVHHFLTWRDVYGGVLLAIIGLGTIYEGFRHSIGSLTRMGAGYFPVILGVVLTGIGGAIAILTLLKGGGSTELEPGEHFHLPDVRGFVAIISGMVAFIVLAAYWGFAPATFALVFISALGDRDSTLKSSAVLACVMTAILIGLFWYALRLPLRLW